MFQVSHWEFQIAKSSFKYLMITSNRESDYAGVDFYESYFNRIAIRGNSAIVFRVEPSFYEIEEMTDSIWYARGNDYRYYDDWDYWE